VLSPAVVRRLAERLDSLLRAEHGDDVGGRFIALEQLWRHDEVMRQVAFSPRLAGLAAELLGEPAIRIYHDDALQRTRLRTHTVASRRRALPARHCSGRHSMDPGHGNPGVHGSIGSCPRWLMYVIRSPICHSTRSERRMTQLSHVGSSTVM